ncbi:hypothetical protein H6G35_24700 [Aulosira sp. FACHB-113]|nr:hypothetical protein [Aulosira sp. FACHB-113]
MPILYQKSRQHKYSLMPWDDVRLDIGDRLIVLATSNSLQRIEWGEMLPRLWQVQIEQAVTSSAMAHAVEKITLITGCTAADVLQWMNNLPTVLPTLLYKYQAQHLVRELKKLQIIASVILIK